MPMNKVQQQTRHRGCRHHLHHHLERSSSGHEHKRLVHPEHPPLRERPFPHQRLEEELHNVRGVQRQPVQPEAVAGSQGGGSDSHGRVEAVEQHVLVQEVLVLLQPVEYRDERARVLPLLGVVGRETVYWEVSAEEPGGRGEEGGGGAEEGGGEEGCEMEEEHLHHVEALVEGVLKHFVESHDRGVLQRTACGVLDPLFGVCCSEVERR
mmetsp:Transcript_44427/g.105468  ORF Transcript_44427/g.105468 Transcript_44427/m.105468 type:complete len:209 (+) Transcript_44427:122-748(+)